MNTFAYPEYTREQLEQALDSRRLWILMSTGTYWEARRNGKTQIWKTRPREYRIPVKMGLRVYGNITQDTDQDALVISDERPKLNDRGARLLTQGQ